VPVGVEGQCVIMAQHPSDYISEITEPSSVGLSTLNLVITNWFQFASVKQTP